MDDNVITFSLLPKEILCNAEHLNPLIKAGQESESKIFILSQCSRNTLREAAGAVAYGCKYKNMVLSKGKKGDQEDEIKRKLDDLWASFSVYNNDEVETGKDEAQKVLLGVCELSVEVEEKTERKQLRTVQYGNKFQNTSGDEIKVILIKGEIQLEIEKEAHKFIAERIGKNKGKYPICICLDGISEQEIRKLEFNFDAERITVKEPDIAFLRDMFLYEVKSANVKLADDFPVENAICMIRSFCGEEFGTDSFKRAVEKALKNMAKQGRTSLQPEDFNFFGQDYQSPQERLDQLIGLDKVKQKIQSLVNMAEFNVRRWGLTQSHGHLHIAFAGNPGSGKSETAAIYADYLAQIGLTNGKFVRVAKSDLVGKYVGHTAAKMKELFDQCRGGVIFIDEAGALLTDDVFTREAITELVRFMELYPDVVCIFASYPEKIEELFETDPGLRGRIPETITFEDYDNDSLFEIFLLFLKKGNFSLEGEDAKDIFCHYVDDMRADKGREFGNARLARNIADKCREVLADWTLADHQDPQKADNITSDMLAEAIRRLKKNVEGCDSLHQIGFDLTGGTC